MIDSQQNMSKHDLQQQEQAQLHTPQAQQQTPQEAPQNQDLAQDENFLMGIAKAIIVIHEATRIPLHALRILTEPRLLTTCSIPGCMQQSRPNSFMCHCHTNQADSMGIDTLSSVRQFYMERVRVLTMVPIQ
jgi:hypothetical protein